MSFVLFIIAVDYAPCNPDGSLDCKKVEQLIRPGTKLLVMTHASNVVGTILPIKDCFTIAKKHDIITVLDAAQTAGYLPIDMQDMQIDVLAFTGHKGLLGLAGIGGFIAKTEIADRIKPLLSGGTGSFSENEFQPDILPDKFESGTRNTLGIVSLHASMEYLNEIGHSALQERGKQQFEHFVGGLQKLPVTIYGTQNAMNSVPVISIGVPAASCDLGEISHRLFQEFAIVTRSGLHCAPLAHKTIGSYPEGTIRFSFGYDTSIEELDMILSALSSILEK